MDGWMLASVTESIHPSSQPASQPARQAPLVPRPSSLSSTKEHLVLWHILKAGKKRKPRFPPFTQGNTAKALIRLEGDQKKRARESTVRGDLRFRGGNASLFLLLLSSRLKSQSKARKKAPEAQTSMPWLSDGWRDAGHLNRGQGSSHVQRRRYGVWVRRTAQSAAHGSSTAGRSARCNPQVTTRIHE